MKTIVITGSTRGIGYGLADSFLALGCAVVISSRTQQAVDLAVAELLDAHEPDRILGQPCDVTDFQQVETLWDVSQAHFNKIDIWINNAGISHPQAEFWEHPPERIDAVVSTNLLGTMYGSRVAVRGMLDQGAGAVYNMEGLGSDGRRVEGLALYSTTKYGLRYLNQALAEEVEETGVIVGAIAPGMLVTDLLTDQYEDRPDDWEEAKRIFNVIADRVETVAPWLAEQVLANEQNGARIAWLTRTKLMGRFLTARFRQRNLFE